MNQSLARYHGTNISANKSPFNVTDVESTSRLRQHNGRI